MEKQAPEKPKPQKVFLIISAVFIALVSYVTIDVMLTTTPPWKKKKIAQSDSTQPTKIDSVYLIDFKDTLIYEYRVGKNEVLSKIAEKFNIKMDTIRLLNQLSDDKIIENQKLKIRIRALHRVKEGEIVERIAKKYGVESKDIIEANKIKNPKQLWADQLIAIPIPLKQ